VKLGRADYVDTTNVLFICGGAFVASMRSWRRPTATASSRPPHTRASASSTASTPDQADDSSNSGSSPSSPDGCDRRALPGPLARIARPHHDRAEERDLRPVPGHLPARGRRVDGRAKVFGQIADLAIEYKAGAPEPARHLRGAADAGALRGPDSPDIRKVTFTSLFETRHRARRAHVVTPVAACCATGHAPARPQDRA